MPELPEVETIRCQLHKNIAGKTIKSVNVLYPKVLRGISVIEFKRALEGKKIRAVERYGKLIIIRLDGNKTLMVHLKLTGRLLVYRTPPLTPPQRGGETIRFSPPLRGRVRGGISKNKSTSVVFTFTNGALLCYDDLRRFGFMKIVPTAEETEFLQKQGLGIDFFDRAMTAEKFKAMIRSCGGSQIKPLLMDQSLMAGIGNIYAQEACFAARVHPLRKANTLNDTEINALYRALQVIMKKAIKDRGSSVDDYLDIFGRKGNFMPRLKVYGREGKPCPRCKTKLLKKNIGGRGTVWCPKCQK